MASSQAEEQIAYFNRRGGRHQSLADHATNDLTRDTHIRFVEHYLDRSWALAENADDLPFIPSSFWERIEKAN